MFQVLVKSSEQNCSLQWLQSEGSDLRTGAVVGGHNERQENIYICRIEISNKRLIGKVNQKHGTCYVPLGDKEVANPSYEVLVAYSPSSAVTESSQILVTNPLHKIYSAVTALPLTGEAGKTEETRSFNLLSS